MAERDQLLGLLRRVVWIAEPDAWWARRRMAWGGLSANDLWGLGCHETVRRAVFDTCDVTAATGFYV